MCIRDRSGENRQQCRFANITLITRTRRNNHGTFHTNENPQANAALDIAPEWQAPGVSYIAAGPHLAGFPFYKAGAPSADMLTPDLYTAQWAEFQRTVDLYARDDNPLFISEMGPSGPGAAYLFDACLLYTSVWHLEERHHEVRPRLGQARHRALPPGADAHGLQDQRLVQPLSGQL